MVGVVASSVFSLAFCVGVAGLWMVTGREETPSEGPATSVIGEPAAAAPPDLPRRPEVTLARNGDRGPVVGQTYGAGEALSPMRGLRGLPFDFDLPEGWGCREGSERLRVDAVWTCVDERGGSRAGGWIGVQSCAEPCGELEQAMFRSALIGTGPVWHATDDTTWYTETPIEIDGDPRLRVAMIHRFAAHPGGPVDTLAFARLTGPVAVTDTLARVVNEVRLRAAG